MNIIVQELDLRETKSILYVKKCIFKISMPFRSCLSGNQARKAQFALEQAMMTQRGSRGLVLPVL